MALPALEPIRDDDLPAFCRFLTEHLSAGRSAEQWAQAFRQDWGVAKPNNAVMTLTFESGALGVIDLSRSGVYGYDIRAEILGTSGTLKVGYLRETPLMILNKAGVTHDTVPYFMERFERAYVAQLQDFIERLQQGKEPSITCADGVADLQVALAATQSYHEKRPITLTNKA